MRAAQKIINYAGDETPNQYKRFGVFYGLSALMSKNAKLRNAIFLTRIVSVIDTGR